MAAETQSAGAASHQERGWHAINWQTANREVRRLQVRIVKAQQQGKWGKVKSLQHVLTHSFSGKALAVKRVTENQGKRTPGVDGEIWKTPQKKAEAIETLTQRGYHPRPLRRIYLPKSNGRLRPLGIPTMKIEPCRLCTCSHSTPWQKSKRTRTRMGLERNAQQRTP